MHELADRAGLGHASVGEGAERRLFVSKPGARLPSEAKMAAPRAPLRCNRGAEAGADGAQRDDANADAVAWLEHDALSAGTGDGRATAPAALSVSRRRRFGGRAPVHSLVACAVSL